jgi:hypothetical protein
MNVPIQGPPPTRFDPFQGTSDDDRDLANGEEGVGSVGQRTRRAGSFGP